MQEEKVVAGPARRALPLLFPLVPKVSGREHLYPSSPVPITPCLTGKLKILYTRSGEGQGLDYFGYHKDNCE